MCTFDKTHWFIGISCAILLGLTGCATPIPTTTKVVTVSTIPSGAAIEVCRERPELNDGTDFKLFAVSPASITWSDYFGDDANGNPLVYPSTLCLIRVSAPGYDQVIKTIPVASMPSELTIPLSKIKN